MTWSMPLATSSSSSWWNSEEGESGENAEIEEIAEIAECAVGGGRTRRMVLLTVDERAYSVQEEW
jgi:hypothetical protein